MTHGPLRGAVSLLICELASLSLDATCTIAAGKVPVYYAPTIGMPHVAPPRNCLRAVALAVAHFVATRKVGNATRQSIPILFEPEQYARQRFPL